MKTSTSFDSYLDDLFEFATPFKKKEAESPSPDPEADEQGQDTSPSPGQQPPAPPAAPPPGQQPQQAAPGQPAQQPGGGAPPQQGQAAQPQPMTADQLIQQVLQGTQAQQVIDLLAGGQGASAAPMPGQAPPVAGQQPPGDDFVTPGMPGEEPGQPTPGAPPAQQFGASADQPPPQQGEAPDQSPYTFGTPGQPDFEGDGEDDEDEDPGLGVDADTLAAIKGPEQWGQNPTGDNGMQAGAVRISRDTKLAHGKAPSVPGTMVRPTLGAVIPPSDGDYFMFDYEGPMAASDMAMPDTREAAAICWRTPVMHGTRDRFDLRVTVAPGEDPDTFRLFGEMVVRDDVKFLDARSQSEVDRADLKNALDELDPDMLKSVVTTMADYEKVWFEGELQDVISEMEEVFGIEVERQAVYDIKALWADGPDPNYEGSPGGKGAAKKKQASSSPGISGDEESSPGPGGTPGFDDGADDGGDDRGSPFSPEGTPASDETPGSPTPGAPPAKGKRSKKDASKKPWEALRGSLRTENMMDASAAMFWDASAPEIRASILSKGNDNGAGLPNINDLVVMVWNMLPEAAKNIAKVGLSWFGMPALESKSYVNGILTTIDTPEGTPASPLGFEPPKPNTFGHWPPSPTPADKRKNKQESQRSFAIAAVGLQRLGYKVELVKKPAAPGRVPKEVYVVTDPQGKRTEYPDSVAISDLAVGKGVKFESMQSYADSLFEGSTAEATHYDGKPIHVPTALLKSDMRQRANSELNTLGNYFASTGAASNQIQAALAKHGIELADSPQWFGASGSQRLDLAFSNPSDPFSPTSISNSVLAVSWHKMDQTGRYEVVAYLS